MNPNDLVLIHFADPNDPSRHDVRWADAQGVVNGLQKVLELAASTVFTPDKRPAFGAVLAASPRRGSLDLLLHFPLLETVQFNTPTAKELLTMVGNGIDGLGDLAGIGSFVLALVLSKRGVIAEVTGQPEPSPQTLLDKLIAREAKRLSGGMAADVRALMNTAYDSGMEVDVEYRDYGRIRLNPANYRRSGRFVGRDRQADSGPLNTELEVTVSKASGPVVTYSGQRYRAVLGDLPRGRVVLLAFDNKPLPKGRLTVRGAVLEDAQNLLASEDLPDDFATAEGPFLVKSFAVWQS